MSLTPPSPCSLCRGQGCVVRLFGLKSSPSCTLSNRVTSVIYGLPLICLLVGAGLGSILGELHSILGAILGLFFAGLMVRACQRFLNRLSL